MNVPDYKYLTQFCRVCGKNKERFEAIFISPTFKIIKNLYVNKFIGDILLTCQPTWVSGLRGWVNWWICGFCESESCVDCVNEMVCKILGQI